MSKGNLTTYEPAQPFDLDEKFYRVNNVNNLEEIKKLMIEKEKGKSRALSALHLIDMALNHSTSSSRAAALIILSLEADNWFKFSAIELVHFDQENRKHANNVLLGVEPSDFKPSNWLDRIGIDVNEKINILIKEWKSLRVI